jgi:hypothetical protein
VGWADLGPLIELLLVIVLSVYALVGIASLVALVAWTWRDRP